MKDAITIEVIDNGYIMRGEDFSQVMEDREENMNIKLGIYLHDLIYHTMNDLGSCKVKIEINITKADV